MSDKPMYYWKSEFHGEFGLSADGTIYRNPGKKYYEREVSASEMYLALVTLYETLMGQENNLGNAEEESHE